MCQTWLSSIMRLTCFSFWTVLSMFWICIHLLMLSPLDWDFPQLTGLFLDHIATEKVEISWYILTTTTKHKTLILASPQSVQFLSARWNKSPVRNWLKGTFFYCATYLDAELCRGLWYPGKEELLCLNLQNSVKQSPTLILAKLHSLACNGTRGTTAEGQYLDTPAKKVG